MLRRLNNFEEAENLCKETLEIDILQCYNSAMEACSDYCFPNRLEDIIVLQDVENSNPEDAKALYYLGNLWYDKKQYNFGICFWKGGEGKASAQYVYCHLESR